MRDFIDPKDAKCITDLGTSLVSDSGMLQIRRYGVWGPDPDKPGSDCVYDTANDLDSLKEKFGNLPLIKMTIK